MERAYHWHLVLSRTGAAPIWFSGLELCEGRAVESATLALGDGYGVEPSQVSLGGGTGGKVGGKAGGKVRVGTGRRRWLRAGSPPSSRHTRKSWPAEVLSVTFVGTHKVGRSAVFCQKAATAHRERRERSMGQERALVGNTPHRSATPATLVTTFLFLLFGAVALGVLLPTNLACGAAPQIEPLGDPLALYRGKPLLLEFPTLANVGNRLEVQEGWNSWQVDAAWIHPLRKRLGVTQLPTILYLDEYGNELLRDQSTMGRRRVGAKIREFQRRQKSLVDRFERLWEEAVHARSKGRRESEINKLNGILETALEGYIQVERARSRIEELNTRAKSLLLRALAQEGLLPHGRFVRPAPTVAPRVRRPAHCQSAGARDCSARSLASIPAIALLSSPRRLRSNCSRTPGERITLNRRLRFDNVRWLAWEEQSGHRRTVERQGHISVDLDSGCIDEVEPVSLDPGDVSMDHDDASLVAHHGLAGRWLLPSFCDSHTHFLYGAQSRCLHWVGRADCAEVIVERLGKSRPNTEGWYVGAGWGDAFAKELPSADSFGAIPAFIFSADHHRAWVNDEGAKRLGVTAGVLLEADAMGAWHRIPRGESFLSDEVRRIHEYGITAVTSFDEGGAVAELSRQSLPLRVFHSLPWREATSALRPPRSGSACQRVEASDLALGVYWAKMFLDGTLGSRSAWLSQPYDDWEGDGSENDSGDSPVTESHGASKHAVHARGIRCVESDEWQQQLPQLVESGLSLAVHAIGDAAVSQALEWILELRQHRGYSPWDRIEHAELLSEELLQRLQEARVVASVQPCHLAEDLKVAAARWGERCRYLLPLRSLCERGVPMVFGTDSPIENFDPWRNLHWATNSGRSEDLDFDQSWWIATAGAASGNPLPKKWGTMEVGAPADLQLVELEHPNDVPDASHARVVALFVGGRQVYGSLPDAGTRWSPPTPGTSVESQG